jgi:hypothetical protein
MSTIPLDMSCPATPPLSERAGVPSRASYQEQQDGFGGGCGADSIRRLPWAPHRRL